MVTGTALAGRHVRGIALAMIASLCFSVMDAMVKFLANAHPMAVIIWTRYVVHVLIALAVIVAVDRGVRGLAAAHLPTQVLRGGLLFVSTASFFVALTLLPLPQASAISSTGPLILIAFAVPLLGEHPGRGQWLGVMIAFVGTVLIVKPGTDFFVWAALLPLVTAVAHSLYQIVTRRMRHRDSNTTTIFYTGIVGALVMTPIVLLRQADLTWEHVAPFVPVGVIGVVGHLSLLMALRSAPVSVVAPFAYTSLIWTTLFGFALWGFVPDTMAVAGMVAIGLGGLCATRGSGRHAEPLAVAAHRD